MALLATFTSTTTSSAAPAAHIPATARAADLTSVDTAADRAARAARTACTVHASTAWSSAGHAPTPTIAANAPYGSTTTVHSACVATT